MEWLAAQLLIRKLHNMEDALLKRFRELATRFNIANLPEADDILGWWEVMQHHGAPTRLLDWTTSPFIASWFAIDGHKEEHGDMAIWLYDRRPIFQLFFSEAWEYLQAFGDHLTIDDRQYQNRVVKFAVDSQKMALVPVRPRQFSRAVAQQSALTVSGTIGAGQHARIWARSISATRIRLDVSWIPEIEDTCRTMGISRVNLFRISIL